MSEPTPELATSLTVDDQTRLLEAEATVRSMCRWHVAPSRPEALKVDGSGSPVLLIPTLCLTDVVSIVEAGDIVDVDDIDWTEAGILTKRSGCWTSRPGGVVVTVEHGFEPIPADLAGVVRAIASRITTDGKTIKARTTGPFSETFSDDDLSSLEQQVIDRYRIPNL